LQSPFTAPLYRLLRVAIGKAMYWHYKLFHKKRYEGVVLEQVCGSPLLVLPGVLNPRLMRTGAFFASQLHPELFGPGSEVLDMGSGSGVCAVSAARHATRVVAVDLNPEAVRCTRINVLLNRLEHKVEVLQGDLFAPLAGRRFDLILFNPPFVRGIPRDDADRAWRSIDVPERFAAGLAEHLRPGGFALVLLSTYGDCERFVHELRCRQLAMSVFARCHFVNETLTLWKVARGRNEAE
jgi:methylase of polypeptide subunit release factors